MPVGRSSSRVRELIARPVFGLVAIVSVPLMIVFALSVKPLTMVEAFSSALSDSFYQWNPRMVPKQVVFVEIENTSVRAYGRWPWQRSLIAQGLAQLNQAQVIGVDMVFSEPTVAGEDQVLAETLLQLPVIGGLFLNGPKAQELDGEAYGQVLDSALSQANGAQLVQSEQVEVSVAPLREATPILAALNILADGDQRFRHYPLAFWLKEAALPNLSVQMWRFATGQDLIFADKAAQLGEHNIPIDVMSRSRLNFYVNGDFERIPFVKLLQPEWDPASLAGKWVIFGVSEAGVSDLRATPLGQYPGPLMHLTFVANLLDDSVLTELKGLGLLGVLLIVVALLSAIFQLKNAWLRLVLYIVLANAVYGLGLGLYLYANLWLEIFFPLLLLVTSVIVGELWLFIRHKAEADYLRSAFGSYVAPQLVEQIVKQGHDLKLGGARKNITLLFSDLRNFTPTTEKLGTEELVSHLNAYFGDMIAQLHRFDGTLDKLMGDGIMAIFNAPLDDKDHAYHACLAGIAMQYALEDFNQAFAQDDIRRLKMGVGINTGEGIVGNIGAAVRFNYTAMGDVVNTAARLESATKEVNLQWQAAIAAGEDKPCAEVDILLGEQTYLAVKDRLPCYSVGKVTLKGKSNALASWVLDWRAVDKQTLGLVLRAK